jgi:hypothetical protein
MEGPEALDLRHSKRPKGLRPSAWHAPERNLDQASAARRQCQRFCVNRLLNDAELRFAEVLADRLRRRDFALCRGDLVSQRVDPL